MALRLNYTHADSCFEIILQAIKFHQFKTMLIPAGKKRGLAVDGEIQHYGKTGLSLQKIYTE